MFPDKLTMKKMWNQWFTDYKIRAREQARQMGQYRGFKNRGLDDFMNIITKRDIEKSLKNQGFSSLWAKKFLSRLPHHWFNEWGEVLLDEVRADEEPDDPIFLDPVQELLQRNLDF